MQYQQLWDFTSTTTVTSKSCSNSCTSSWTWATFIITQLQSRPGSHTLCRSLVLSGSGIRVICETSTDLQYLSRSRCRTSMWHFKGPWLLRLCDIRYDTWELATSALYRQPEVPVTHYTQQIFHADLRLIWCRQRELSHLVLIHHRYDAGASRPTHVMCGRYGSAMPNCCWTARIGVIHV